MPERKTDMLCRVELPGGAKMWSHGPVGAGEFATVFAPRAVGRQHGVSRERRPMEGFSGSVGARGWRAPPLD